MLVHETMLMAGVDRLVERTPNAARLREHLTTSHSTAADAAAIARDAGVGRLVLNHLIPADDPAFDDADFEREVRAVWNGPLTIGSDGLSIPLDGSFRAPAL